MKKEQIVPIIIVAVVILSAVIAGIYFVANPTAWQMILVELGLAEPVTGGISASGFIEAEEISIAPEIGGRIVEMPIQEGELVESGQPLVRLDDTLIQAQVQVAQAGLETAQALLAQVEAGARPEQIREAEALLVQAQAGRDGAYQAWQDMLALLENPQELEAQIALAEAQVAQADAGLRQAGFMRDLGQSGQNAYEGGLREFDLALEQWEAIPEAFRPPKPELPPEVHLTPLYYWRSWIGFNMAGASYESAQQALSLLYEMRDNPQQMQAQVDAAQAQYQAAEAMVALAQAQLDGLESGATEEEMAAAEAQVQLAQAQLDSVLVLLKKLTLTSPAGGRVLETMGHVGELAIPAATLVTVADLDQVTLTVYVPENLLGNVGIGQDVEVRVDSFPDRVFVGQVATIASEAEFTPRNIQTQEERVNMVFAVKVTIPNPDHVLKPGMPADAVILTQE